MICVEKEAGATPRSHLRSCIYPGFQRSALGSATQGGTASMLQGCWRRPPKIPVLGHRGQKLGNDKRVKRHKRMSIMDIILPLRTCESREILP